MKSSRIITGMMQFSHMQEQQTWFTYRQQQMHMLVLPQQLLQLQQQQGQQRYNEENQKKLVYHQLEVAFLYLSTETSIPNVLIIMFIRLFRVSSEFSIPIT